MKKLLILFIILITSISITAQKKISELTEATTASNSHLFLVTIDSSGTQVSRKLEYSTIKSANDLRYQLAQDSSFADLSQEIQDSILTTIYANRIASGAVTESKIADGAVTSNKLGANSVNSTKIAALAVQEADIQGAAVTESKIASGAVSWSKLATAVQDSINAGGIDTTYRVVWLDNNQNYTSSVSTLSEYVMNCSTSTAPVTMIRFSFVKRSNDKKIILRTFGKVNGVQSVGMYPSLGYEFEINSSGSYDAFVDLTSYTIGSYNEIETEIDISTLSNGIHTAAIALQADPDAVCNNHEVSIQYPVVEIKSY